MPQVGHLPELNEDARSEKYKKPVINSQKSSIQENFSEAQKVIPPKMFKFRIPYEQPTKETANLSG